MLKPVTNADLDSRVATLEESVRGISNQVAGIGQSLSGIRDELSRAGKPDYQVVISAIGLCILLLSAAFVPLWLSINNVERIADKATLWQEEYTRGMIPSSADPKIAAMSQMFTEVETQFRAFKERMLENEEIMNKRADFNLRHIEEDHQKIEQLESAIAFEKGREDKDNGKLLH